MPKQLTIDHPLTTTIHMLRLIAFRHAKSAWTEPGLTDFERPLNKRGQIDAPRMGKWFLENGYRPDLVLCSPSERTRETYRLMCEGYDEVFPCEFVQSLYLPGTEEILSCMKNVSNEKKTVMIIAHNPGLHEAVLDFLTPSERSASGGLRARYPTCGVAVIDFAIERWADLSWSIGTLHAYMEPKQISQTGEGIATT